MLTRLIIWQDKYFSKNWKPQKKLKFNNHPIQCIIKTIYQYLHYLK